jgi:hypothetical protein
MTNIQHSLHAQTPLNDADMDQEISVDQLGDCSGGMWGTLLKSFAKAVYNGAKEIKEVQETGELPDRFFTPISNVGGGSSGVWNPPGGEQGGCGVNH